MNESCLIWMSHVSYEWVMSHVCSNSLQRTEIHKALGHPTFDFCDVHTLQQHTATHCNTATTHCNAPKFIKTWAPNFWFLRCTHTATLQHTATTHCNTPKFINAWATQILISRYTHTATTHCNNTLQHTATHCIVPKFIKDYATQFLIFSMRYIKEISDRCNTLQRAATHRNTLQHTATHCNALQHTATHCNTLQRTEIHKGLRYPIFGFLDAVHQRDIR